MRRIARNTFLLFAKQAVSIAAEIVALGMVMRALGADGYGVYAAAFGVMGVVFMLSGALNEVFCRFISYEIGKGGRGDVPAVFASTLLLTVLFLCVTLLIGESAGLWFVRRWLVVPGGLAGPAVRAYHAILVSTAVGALSIPFSAYALATERMGVVAQMGFLASGVSVVVAPALFLFAPENRLVAYAGLEVAGAAVVTLAYAVRFSAVLRMSFCARGVWRRLMSTGSYFLWSSLRSVAHTIRFQGTQLYGNACYGVAFNGAWGAAMRFGQWLFAPAVCFRDAYTPRIVKLRAEGDVRRFLSLVVRCSVLSALIFLAFAVPAFICAPGLGRIWLGSAMPADFVPFVRWVLVFFLFDSVIYPLHSAIASDERIAGYQTVVSVIIALGFGFAVLLLACGLPPSSAVAGVAIGNGVSLVYRIGYLRFRTLAAKGDCSGRADMR